MPQWPWAAFRRRSARRRRHQRPRGDAAGCDAVEGPQLVASFADMAGSYDVQLVVDSSRHARVGTSAVGRLELQPFALNSAWSVNPPGSEIGRSRSAYIGTLEAPLKRLGIVLYGGPDEARMPLVTLEEEFRDSLPTGRAILARALVVPVHVAGEIAIDTTRAIVRSDGDGIMLEFRAIEGARVRGSWLAEGAFGHVYARGHFCASRVRRP